MTPGGPITHSLTEDAQTPLRVACGDREAVGRVTPTGGFCPALRGVSAMPGNYPSSPTAAQIRATHDADLSDLFRLVASLDPAAANVDRNGAAEALARSTDPEDPDPDEIRARIERSGDYVGNLAEGDLAGALYHSDGTHRRLLIRMLSEDLLLAALAEDRGSMDSARRWLDPERERYGWDTTPTVATVDAPALERRDDRVTDPVRPGDGDTDE